MKAIFKGNKFAIQWTIKDAVTSLPFDFTGMFVEYILYSDSYKGRIVGATTNINKMQAEIPANILPVGVYNIICKYRNSINEGHCIYRNAFQITRNPEFIGCDNVVVIESFSAPLKLENMDINYLGHFTSSDLLIDCNQPSWALVGKLNEAEPWFFYTEDAIPAGSQYGWNNMSEILGTYNLTEDKVSIYDFNLITEYNVSRNHTHTERKFSPHWGATTKYYPEYEEYSPCKIYEKDERVNMPGYTENSFIALHQTSDAPYEIINETSEFSFSEAINLVPEEFRFPGIRMTYVKKDTHQAETWFYKGGSWENKNSWVKPDGNVTINNLPDEEDIASIGDNAPVLKLKDKVYNPQTFSGLGRTYLRKNIINGINVLTQDMMLKENTRYIIQYDYELNDVEIEVPVGCVLVFDGGSLSNGSIRFNGTLLLGAINIESTCKPVGSIRNRSLNVDWFGAKNNGVSDCTNVIKNVIELVYNSTEHSNSSFNKVSPVIEFGYGTYLVKDTLIKEDSPLKYGSFIFNGDGVVGTTVKYLGASDSYLFYNKEIFAYTEFNNIRFIGNDQNKFMYLYSSSSTGSIVQSITFNSCRFAQFKNITTCEGDAMCSEVSFNMCKVVYFPNTDSELFVFNNLQALNWRFYGTDIEQTRGTIFKILQGVYISMYSCSIIPFEGTVISVPSTADTNQFWLTNTPSIAMYSCRFEIRDNSQLLNINNKAYLEFVFNTCNMGGFNIGDATDVYTIDISSPNNINQVKIIFNECSNFLKYKYRVVGDNNSYSGWVESFFNNCIVDVNAILSQSILPSINDMPAAPEGSPKFFIDGEYISYMTYNSIRNGMSPINYIVKSATNQHLTANLAAGKIATFDNSNFFRVNSYVGGITFNIRPSTDIYINIVNSEGTIIYGRFSIKAWSYFNQTVQVGKFITENSSVVMYITNKSTTATAYIEGFCEITTSVSSNHTLNLAENLSDLNAKQNGLIAYHNTRHMPLVWDGTNTCWRDANGFRTIGAHQGVTNDRPTPSTADIGYVYFDTTLNKAIWWNGSIWVDATGNQV